MLRLLRLVIKKFFFFDRNYILFVFELKVFKKLKIKKSKIKNSKKENNLKNKNRNKIENKQILIIILIK